MFKGCIGDKASGVATRKNDEKRGKSRGTRTGTRGNAFELFSVSFIHRYVTVVQAVRSNCIDIEHVYLPVRLK